MNKDFTQRCKEVGEKTPRLCETLGSLRETTDEQRTERTRVRRNRR